MAQKYMPEGWDKTSRENIDIRGKIEKIKAAKEKNETLQGYVKFVDDKYNLVIDLGGGGVGKVPREEVSSVLDEDGLPNPRASVSKLKRIIQVKVKEIIQNGNEVEIILSRKEVENEVRKWMYQNLKEGMVLNGIVRNVQPYGVFVEIGGGVTGLLHIEDITVARIKSPSERFKLGEKIKVVVKSYDRDTGKIVLSHKELLGTWEENVKEFKEGDTVYGITRSREKNGIFVELKPNLVGLAEHRSGIDYGQKVLVYIKKIVPDKKKIKLVIIG